MFPRSLQLPKNKKDSLFLWGPRQVGKTTLLKHSFPDVHFIQLLKSDVFTRYATIPGLLQQEVRQNKWSFVVIDEIQKVPHLLDDVHDLIEDKGVTFVLCGSSARKVKAGHANLLGGRALRYSLFGITAQELDQEFDLIKILNRGYLPRVYLHDQYLQLLQSYVSDYLKEEVFAEGLVRKLPPFSTFLEKAALSDAEVISYETFARDCGVSGPTIRSYFEILFDTLLATYLPAYTKKPKRKTIGKPKLYFFDVGVVNCLAARGSITAKSSLFGKAFENWVHHELKSYLSYNQRTEPLSYWRLTTGVEVDFIIGNMECAIEAKSSSKIHSDHLKGLRELKAEYPSIKRRIIVSTEPSSRQLDDGIEILSVEDFINLLKTKGI